MKTIVASILICAGMLLSACGGTVASGAASASSHAREAGEPRNNRNSPGSVARLLRSIAERAESHDPAQGASHGPLTFRDTEYYTSIIAVKPSLAYVYFTTVRRDVTVTRSSAARIKVTTVQPPRFASSADRVHWQAAGSPPLPVAGPEGHVIALGPGEFTFMPQGASLTYADVRSFPGSPRAVRGDVMAHLRAYAGSHPPAELVLRQFGFLLAAAPLAKGARAATWRALASIGGLHMCRPGTDLLGREGQGICAETGQDSTKILVNSETATVLEVEERILKPSRLYPGLTAGTLIESDAFTMGSAS
jgi:hypothetical protein